MNKEEQLLVWRYRIWSNPNKRKMMYEYWPCCAPKWKAIMRKWGVYDD